MKPYKKVNYKEHRLKKKGRESRICLKIYNLIRIRKRKLRKKEDQSGTMKTMNPCLLILEQ